MYADKGIPPRLLFKCSSFFECKAKRERRFAFSVWCVFHGLLSSPRTTNAQIIGLHSNPLGLEGTGFQECVGDVVSIKEQIESEPLHGCFTRAEIGKGMLATPSRNKNPK
mgnify:CR=1 FL=1